MPTKEQTKQYLEKWNTLLSGLDKAKYKRYKYCRLYEKTIQNNKKENYKILLSLMYKIFKKYPDITISRSHTNVIDILEFEEKEIFQNGQIRIDIAISFLDALSEMVIEKLQEINCLAYLTIEKRGNIHNVIKLYY